MKVRCVQLKNWRGETRQRSDWLKLGSVYHVLELAVDRGQVSVRLLGEDKTTPAIYSMNRFEIVSPTLPENWIVDQPTKDYLSLTPAPWARPGFWTDYFDRKPHAIASFQEELSKILASD